MADRSTKTEITPLELKAKLDRGDKPLILDIREPYELPISALPEFKHIPMGQVVQRMPELESYKESEVVVVCRSGQRSGVIADYMRQKGFSKVYNLTGGLNEWADTVDRNMQKY
ncbi:MAG TPA: rhodanese-like domain-containing protein [Candidatus Obscuribacterales bacterium]